MEWKLIAEKRVDGGAHLTIGAGGYTLDTIIPDGPGREQIIEAYVQQITRIATTAAKQKASEKPPLNPPQKKGDCGCGKKTLGIVSLGKALLGGAALPEIAAQRMAICQACQAADPTGARLFRVIDGKAYCGVPRLADPTKVYRDEREWGCGCELAWKAGMKEAHCPLSVW